MLLLLVGGVTCSEFKWGYSKYDGPRVWGEHYPECEEYSQSPIVLPTAFADHPFLQTIEYHNFEKWNVDLTQDGKSIVLYVKDTGKERPYITGAVFKTKQFLDKIVIKVGTHCRGSEHGMDGIFYDGEISYFYYDKKYKNYDEAVEVPGGVAIVSVLLKEQKESNPAFDQILKNLPQISNSKSPIACTLEGELNTPVYVTEKKEKECVNCDYYFYEGSLSTPPCSQVALRFVYAYPLNIGEDQLDKLREVLSCETGKPMVNNYRYPQPLNFRKVFQHHERDAKYYRFPDPEDMPPPPPPPPGHMMPGMPGNRPNMGIRPDMANMPNMGNMPNMANRMPPRMPQPGTQNYQPQQQVPVKPTKIRYAPTSNQLT